MKRLLVYSNGEYTHPTQERSSISSWILHKTPRPLCCTNELPRITSMRTPLCINSAGTEQRLCKRPVGDIFKSNIEENQLLYSRDDLLL